MIAIDPGGSRKGCAGARFDSSGELMSVKADASEYASGDVRIVIERPQQDGRSRAVPPKVLIELAWNGALLAGRLAGVYGYVVAYTPAQWKCGPKGNESIAKAIHHSRLVHALTEAEAEVLDMAFPRWADAISAAVRKGALSRWAPGTHYPRGSALPDVLDAVGLGLFDLGRIDTRGNPK